MKKAEEMWINPTLVTRENILAEAVERCYAEMYANAQPSADFLELSKKARAGEEDEKNPFYMQHYLSEKEINTIVDKYVDAYGLHCPFDEHCETIMNYLANGIIDKYIERDGDSPGYRGYEDLPHIKETIGEDAYNAVIERIKQAMDFYRFNREESSFKFTVLLGCAPTSNKQQVIDYWKSQGVDLEIKDRDENEIFERHYYDITEFDENDYAENMD